MGREELLGRVAETVVDATNPVRVIAIGSLARGEADGECDLDLMVVKNQVQNRTNEMVRLSRLLRQFGVPVDILVVSADRFNYWKATPGNVYHAAATEGRTLYEAA